MATRSRKLTRAADAPFASTRPSILELLLEEAPLELAERVLFLLPAQTLNALAGVNRLWRGVASKSLAWESHVEATWRDKVYVAKELRELRQSDPRQAYFASLAAAERCFIRKEELVGFEWSFRFKEAAGVDWSEIDPWHQGRRAAQVRFEPGGKVTSTNAALRVGPIRWRFPRARRQLGGSRADRLHQHVSVSVAGKAVPTYIVRRAPNWGFILESCWVMYTSFEMPARGVDPALEVSTVSVDDQLDEACAWGLADD